MKNKNTQSMPLLLVFILSMFSNVTFSQQPAIPGFPASPEEFQQWEKEIDAQIDTYVNNLPEEERKDFYKQVDELTEMMKGMSDDELLQFVETVFEEEAANQQIPSEYLEEPTELKEEKAPEPVQTPSEREQIQKLATMIDEITTYIERFILTSGRIPELPGRIQRWIEENKLKEWKKGQTWDGVKAAIENLNQKFYGLLETDPETKKYRHLDDLIKNESVNNAISRLHRVLAENLGRNPIIKAPPHGLGEVSKETRKAIQTVLNLLGETIYTLDLPTELDKIMKKFDPRSQELIKKEEEQRKKAIEESKKARTAAPTKVVGSPIPTGGDYYPTTDYGTTPGYYPSYSSGGSGYEPYQSPTGTTSGGGGSSGGGTGGSRGGARPTEEEEKEAFVKGGGGHGGDAGAKGEAGKKKEADKKEKPLPDELKSQVSGVTKLIDQANDMLDEAVELSDTGSMQDFFKLITSGKTEAINTALGIEPEVAKGAIVPAVAAADKKPQSTAAKSLENAANRLSRAAKRAKKIESKGQKDSVKKQLNVPIDAGSLKDFEAEMKKLNQDQRKLLPAQIMQVYDNLGELTKEISTVK